MTQQNSASYTEQDLRSVAQKMAEWGKSLPGGEQQALKSIVQRAANKDQDVQGYEYAVPVAEDAYGEILWNVFSDFGYYEGQVVTDRYGNIL